MLKKIVLFSATVLSLCANATPHNIAPSAKVKTSSNLSDELSGKNLVDGIIGVPMKGEWVSDSHQTFWGQINYPSATLEWDSPVNINKIVLYGRASETSHIAGGTLHFSDGSKIFVHAIPKNAGAKAVEFPSKKVSWVKFEATDAEGEKLGLSEIEVYPSFEGSSDYVSKVNPYIETARGRYFFFVTGSQPFGMISAAPLTRNKNQFGGGYDYNTLEILGFPQVHGWMLSGVNFMPTLGDVYPQKGEEFWKSPFSHDGEIVQPAYHRVFLEKYGIWVEQTASDRVSFYQMRYTKDGVANMLVSLGGYLSTSTMNDCEVKKVGNTKIEGSVNTTGRLWGGPENVRIFFVAEFEKPFDNLNSWDASNVYPNVNFHKGSAEKKAKNEGMSYYDAPASGVSAVYNSVKAGDVLKVKFAISYTSIENARKNLESEAKGWDFDALKNASQKEWNEMLGRIDAKGGSVVRLEKFYTDLWHVLLGRHKLDDFSGDYPDYTKDNKLKIRSLPKGKDGKPKFHMYNSDAFWLTQWNLNVLWGLAWPEVLDDFAACLVEYDANGGLLPRGPCAGGYSFIMTGCPATNLICSAYQKNMLTKVDAEKAYMAMVRNHTEGGMLGGRGEIEFYEKNGFFPNNAGITLEISFQDWSLAQMAKKMGKKEDFERFDKRSHGWTALLHPEKLLIFPKNWDGKWQHENPLSMDGWVESNSWQATWSVSHDLEILARLMGGRDAMADKLNFAFEQSRKDDFVYGYGGGYVSYANQPGCSNAHVFNIIDKPWLSQYWVRRVGEQAYGANTPDRGYGGHDEDQGQMGGISALMAMGIFAVQGNNAANPTYEITSPVFDEITIRLNPKYYKGKTFKIKTHNNSEENCYIQKAKLNGAIHNKYWFPHGEYAKGGVLELWLGDKPNKSWGVK